MCILSICGVCSGFGSVSCLFVCQVLLGRACFAEFGLQVGCDEGFRVLGGGISEMGFAPWHGWSRESGVKGMEVV